MSNKPVVTGLIVAVLVTVVAGGFILLRHDPVESPYPTPDDGAVNGGSTNENPPVETSLVRVDYPRPNESVSNPLTVVGSARGNWFFEASFPIRVLDANGRELGVSPAQAQGDWMTTEFVPFTGTITFAAPTTQTGTLVLEKDNPSGLPENADEVRVPIRFAQVATETREVTLYFYSENKDKDASGNILCSAKGLVPVKRTIPLTITPIQDAVRELLKGPSTTERPDAPSTEFPLAGVRLTGASLSSGVLTLSFNDSGNQTSGGSCRVGVLRAQVEATAKQFGGVNTVRYQPIGVFEP